MLKTTPSLSILDLQELQPELWMYYGENLSQLPCLLTHQKALSVWFQASWFAYVLVDLNQTFTPLKDSLDSFSCRLARTLSFVCTPAFYFPG